MTTTLLSGMTTLQALREGALLSRYTLLEQIGRGGQADVWSAWDPATECVVAIKVIQMNPPISTSQQFSREAHLVARLQHPRIVPLYDYGEMMTLRFLVTRYMVGGSVLSLLKQGPLAPSKFAKIAMTVSNALDFIHDQFIVHRDLKPANILLDSYQEAYLSDFGIARDLGITPTLALNTPEGTVPYMSPEQLYSERITSRTDMYGLGILLFQLLTGRLPFEGRQVMAIQQHQSGVQLPDPAAFNPTLPDGVAPILRQLTALDPVQRPEKCVESVSRLVALFGLTPPADITMSPVLLPKEEITHHPLEEARSDALHMLTTAAQTWTPEQEYPFTLTIYRFLAAACPDPASCQPPLPPRANQMLLYGSLKFESAVGQPEAATERYWNVLSDAMRRELCWAVLAKAEALPLSPTVERVLTLANTLPPTEELPPGIVQSLINLTRSAVTSRGKATIGERVLNLLVRKQESASGNWQETDPLVADLLADLVSQQTPLAAQALQAIIQQRSANAVRRLMAQMGTRRRLEVLRSIWTETRSLPRHDLSAPQYVTALVWIGLRQLAEHPLWLLADYAALSLGYIVALGLFIYLTFNSPDFVSSMRIQNALANGLLFGVQLGLSASLAYTIAERLLIVSAGVRFLLSTLIGGLAGTWAFNNFYLLFYHFSPIGHLIWPGATVFASGFAIAGMCRRISIRATVITLGILAAVMLTWFVSLNTGDDPLLYLVDDAPLANWLLGILVAATAGTISQAIIYLYRRNARGHKIIIRNS